MQDRLVAVGLGQRPGGGGLRRGRVGLGLDLGLLERQRALRDRDLLLGGDRRLLGGLPGVRLGDPGRLADPRGLGATEVGEVAAVVGDVLDLEGVEDQALAGQGVLRLVGHPLGERRAVADDLLDGQAADDGAQRAGEHLLGERLDVLLLAQEPLGGQPDLVGVAADLHDRDALDVELDALAGHRAADLHRDPPAGEVHRRGPSRPSTTGPTTWPC